jgi:hypothetical protein
VGRVRADDRGVRSGFWAIIAALLAKIWYYQLVAGIGETIRPRVLVGPGLGGFGRRLAGDPMVLGFDWPGIGQGVALVRVVPGGRDGREPFLFYSHPRLELPVAGWQGLMRVAYWMRPWITSIR